MNRDYSALLMEYPEVISKEQVYRICHISKRKATWLLENGIIPCKDSGKKTRRFQVRTIDVINCNKLLVNSRREASKGCNPCWALHQHKQGEKNASNYTYPR